MTASRSLAARLFWAGTLWSVAALVVVGVTLSQYYRAAAERAYDERLYLYLRTLVFDLASHGELARANVASIGDPRFEFPLSGWYWQVSRIGGEADEFKASRSLFDQTLPKLLDMDDDADTTVTREAYVRGPDDQDLRQVERVVTMSGGERYLVAVAGDAVDITSEIRTFNTALTVSFVILALGLLAVAAVQVRWGLRPLKKISENIAEIRAGRADRIDEKVPSEVAPLARELNALIESNREIVERARTHVGNLAHALKTPLSVITNEASANRGALAGKVAEQAQLMRTQVDHHLQRARIAAGTALIGAVTEVRPVADNLARVMRKVHKTRNLFIETRGDTARFRGEQQDLEEMVGNLVDNACKWAEGRVVIEVMHQPAEGGSRAFLRLLVDDDGPGLTSAQREDALKRGRRLDETKPGSGLGLAIVSDLATLYGGELRLASSPAGGLRADLRLPAA